MESDGEAADVFDGNKRKKRKKYFNKKYILYLLIMILPSLLCYWRMNNKMKEQLEKIKKEMPSNNQMKEQLGKIQKEISSKLLPKGVIVSWFGSIKEIPKGWALCDGNNTTPDLRNRFIIGGGDIYNFGEKGGKSSIVLDKSNLPKLGKGYFSSPSVNGVYDERRDELIKYINHYKTGFGRALYGEDTWGANYEIDLNEGFESIPVDIMNPYYSIYYIMKIE